MCHKQYIMITVVKHLFVIVGRHSDCNFHQIIIEHNNK